jgi:hypothetical protein
MVETKMTNHESLLLIEQMIGRAKREEKDSGWGWIIWGFLLFSASLTHYVLILFGINNGGTVWNVFGVLAVILVTVSFSKKYFSKGSASVKTYTGEQVDMIGNGFFISLGIMVIGNITTDVGNTGANFGYLLLLYACWLFIHGAAFRFKPMKYGAFINWAGALVIFLWYKDLGKHVPVIHAICVLLGYIIPGFMAQKNFERKNSEVDNVTL